MNASRLTTLIDAHLDGTLTAVEAEELSTALVANPGCYPTAALLALGPLLRANLIEPCGIKIGRAHV